MKTQGKVWVLFDTETKSQSKPMSVVQTQMILLSLSKASMKKFLIWTPGWEEWEVVLDFLGSDQTYFAIVQPPAPGMPSKKDLQDHDTITKSMGSLSDSHSGMESPFTQVFMGEAPLKNQETGGYYFQDFNGDDLDLQKIINAKTQSTKNKQDFLRKKDSSADKDSERRRDPRHNFKIEVVLVSKVRSFRTYSKNISISGTLLEDEVPKDFLGQQFDLILVNPFEPDKTKARLLFKAKIVGDLTDPRRLMFIEEDRYMTTQLDALLHAYTTYQKQMKRPTGT